MKGQSGYPAKARTNHRCYVCGGRIRRAEPVEFDPEEVQLDLRPIYGDFRMRARHPVCKPRFDPLDDSIGGTEDQISSTGKT